MSIAEDVDRIIAEECATMLGWDEPGTAERNDIIKAHQSATLAERSKYVGLEQRIAKLEREVAILKSRTKPVKLRYYKR